MPLEFALRPRLRLRESVAETRRSRLRLPKLALPILTYWLAVGGISYELIHLHDAPSSALEEPPKTPAVEPERAQTWWQQALAGAPLARAPEPTEPPLARAPEPTEPLLERAAEPVSDDSSERAPARHADNASARSTVARSAEPPRPELPQSTPTISNRDGDTPDSPAPSPAPMEPRAGKSLPSCEAAAAAASEELDLAHRALTPDLPRESIATVLDNGAWLTGCSIPDSTSLDVCVAISSGSVIGATVVAHPGNVALSACLKRRAAALLFPYSTHLDLARTHFDAH